MLTAVLFGLVPSISSVRSTPQSALREATRGSSSGRSRNGLRSSLIVSEVALAVILLAAAGLLGRSFWELNRVDPGFRTDRVLTMRTTLPDSRYDTDERIRAFSRELLERIEHLPGVQVVGSVNYLPMSRFGAANRFEIEGRPEARLEDQKFSWVSVVGGRYFEALGIPLLRGRFPSDADTEKAQPVVIIDEELARRYWAGENPIGTRIAWRRGEERLSGEIIGVVGGVRWGGMASGPQATTYFWFPQDPGRQLTIVARTVEDPLVLARAIAAQVGEIDPNQPVAEIQAMRDFVSADLAQPRFTMLLLGSFAAAALLLSAIGLYGVIAFGVTQRTREIGVRVALGAPYGNVLRLVMQHGMLLTGTGLVIGTAAALALGRVMTGLLYGVTPTDPPTLLAVLLFLAAVAMLATYLPARRAARVDPMVALRAE
jgi:putative ABC transport system permease protein